MNFSNKNILVTGGAGFIGSTIAKKLYDMNSQITILDNFSLGKQCNIKFQCEIVEGNIVDPRSLSGIYDTDYVLHFGAPSSIVLFNQNPEKSIIETILGLRNILEYSKNTGVKKVIFPSSSSIYGNTPLPQSETAKTIPTNLYGFSKLTCEYIAKLYSDQISSVGLRIFAGYGPGEVHKGDFSSVITLFMKSIKNNIKPIIFGDGTQSRDFVYIDDIVLAIIRSIESSFEGIINVGSGESHSFNEVLDILNNMFGKTLTGRYVEKPTNYFEHTQADTTNMKKELNITPINLNEGLKKYVYTRSIK